MALLFLTVFWYWHLGNAFRRNACLQRWNTNRLRYTYNTAIYFARSFRQLYRRIVKKAE